MNLSEEFRARAQRCLALAGAAPTVEAHSHWLSMAQLWLNLAQYAEDQDSAFEHDASLAMAAGQGERPPANENVAAGQGK